MYLVDLPVEYKGVKIRDWFSSKQRKIKSVNDKYYLLLSKNKYVKERLDKYLNRDD